MPPLLLPHSVQLYLSLQVGVGEGEGEGEGVADEAEMRRVGQRGLAPLVRLY